MRTVLCLRASLRPIALTQSLPLSKRFYEKVAPSVAIEAQAAGAGAFIDVRPRDAFAEVHADGFINIPHGELAQKLAQVPKGAPVYLLDQWGFYSERAAKTLEAADYRDVRVVEGGLVTWSFRGGPVTAANATVAARLKRHRESTPSLAAIEGVASEMGVSVDISDRRFPYLDKIFDTEADKEEAVKRSWAKKAKGASS